LPAGADPTGVVVGAAQAVRIMTGAPLPDGADAVVMVEDTTTSGAAVTIGRAAHVGDHVRGAGDDVTPGQLVFAAGTALGPGHLGVLASIGLPAVRAHPRPRVGVLSTGDELVESGDPLRPGQLRDANRHTLLALARRSDCDAIDLGLARDDEDEITRVIEKGVAECDALVTSGGVSVGDFDYVKVVLDRLGTMNWWQVAIKPAKPLAFGLVAGKPVFGLPGNTVSSMVSFELFARPALRQLAGHEGGGRFRPTVAAVADEPLRRRPDGKLHLVRVVASIGDDGRHHVRSSGGQGSHQLWAMASANGLALVPDGEGVDAGDVVETMLLAADVG
jgi:molybdenum cofactor synthesis domain-containing protein